MIKNRLYSRILIPLTVALLVAGGAYYWKHHGNNNIQKIDIIITQPAESEPLISVSEITPETAVAIKDDIEEALELAEIEQALESAQTEQSQGQRMTQLSKNGLTFEIIKPAPTDAQKPNPGDIANVHYTGWINENGVPGRMFDSSVERGEPFSFPVGVGYVIKGWDQTVLDMPIGEIRRVFIPSALGYGARGAGAAIPPNSDLIFDIELISLEND